MTRTVAWSVAMAATLGVAAWSCGEEFDSGSSTTTTTAQGGSTTTPPAGGGGATTTTGQGGRGQGGAGPTGGSGGGPPGEGGAGGQHVRTCLERFDALPDFHYCGEVADQCRFEVDAAGASCQQICREEGVDCASAHTISGSCAITGTIGCTAAEDGLIMCVCVATCNGGPACENGPCTATGCVDNS